jgi:hypothetical protein
LLLANLRNILLRALLSLWFTAGEILLQQSVNCFVHNEFFSFERRPNLIARPWQIHVQDLFVDPVHILLGEL